MWYFFTEDTVVFKVGLFSLITYPQKCILSLNLPVPLLIGISSTVLLITNNSPFWGPHSKVNFSFQWLNYGVYFSLIQSSLQKGSFSRGLSSMRELTSRHSEVTVVPTSSIAGHESMLGLVLGLQVQRIHKWIMTWSHGEESRTGNTGSS